MDADRVRCRVFYQRGELEFRVPFSPAPFFVPFARHVFFFFCILHAESCAFESQNGAPRPIVCLEILGITSFHVRGKCAMLCHRSDERIV